MFFLQNTGLPEDPVDLEIDLDCVGSSSDIRDNDDKVDGEDTKANDDDDHDAVCRSEREERPRKLHKHFFNQAIFY